MKKIVTAMVLLASATAYAQSSSTELPTTGNAAAVNTVTTTATEVKPPAAKKVTSSLVLGLYAGVADVKENGSGAMIDSSNTLSVNYAITDKQKVGLGHNFALRSVGDSAQLADFASDNGPDSGYKTLDPTLLHSYKMGSLLGSSPYSIASRYYMPISQASQAAKSNGVLRTQAFVTWTMNPKIDISFLAQARLYMNSAQNPKTALGSDSVLRVIAGPNFGYNFTEKVNAYYSPYLDMRSVGFQRGKFDADTVNDMGNELGLWLTLAGGDLIINPAWLTTSSKLGGTAYEGTGSDSNSEYDLNVIAYF